MNEKISVFVICVEVIIYLLLYNLHDFTFNDFISECEQTRRKLQIYPSLHRNLNRKLHFLCSEKDTLKILLV